MEGRSCVTGRAFRVAQWVSHQIRGIFVYTIWVHAACCGAGSNSLRASQRRETKNPLHNSVRFKKLMTGMSARQLSETCIV